MILTHKKAIDAKLTSRRATRNVNDFAAVVARELDQFVLAWEVRLGTWQAACKRILKEMVLGDAALSDCLHDIFEVGDNRAQLHLAIFVEPYLTFILEGKKTVESRFSSVRCAPYDKVRAGDVILLKKAGGPVTGVCRANSAWFYEVDRSNLKEIRREFAEQICPAESDFWATREDTSFATLISLADAKRLPEFVVGKRDRRGWVTIA
jgi:ASC-1-like (ASCH) protein